MTTVIALELNTHNTPKNQSRAYSLSPIKPTTRHSLSHHILEREKRVFRERKMAKKLATSFIILLIAILLVGRNPKVEAQGIICNVSQEGLLACRSAVTKPNPANPSAACCAALANANLPCLCAFKNSNPTAMRLVGIDPDLATALPTKCNLPTPDKC